MQKEFKIGMYIGLALISIAMIWVSVRPRPSEQWAPAVPLSEQKNPQANQAEPSWQKTTESSIRSLPDLTIYEQSEKIKTQRFHIVTEGETLSSISEKYYDTTAEWQKIKQANVDIIKNSDKLKLGMKLIIPE